MLLLDAANPVLWALTLTAQTTIPPREDKVEGALVHNVQVSEGSVVPENLSSEVEHLKTRMDPCPIFDLGLDIPDGVPGVYLLEGEGPAIATASVGLSIYDHKDFHAEFRVFECVICLLHIFFKLEF